MSNNNGMFYISTKKYSEYANNFKKSSQVLLKSNYNYTPSNYEFNKSSHFNINNKFVLTDDKISLNSVKTSIHDNDIGFSGSSMPVSLKPHNNNTYEKPYNYGQCFTERERLAIPFDINYKPKISDIVNNK
jgi:hypothetical protein